MKAGLSQCQPIREQTNWCSLHCLSAPLSYSLAFTFFLPTLSLHRSSSLFGHAFLFVVPLKNLFFFLYFCIYIILGRIPENKNMQYWDICVDAGLTLTSQIITVIVLMWVNLLEIDRCVFALLFFSTTHQRERKWNVSQRSTTRPLIVSFRFYFNTLK